MPFCYLKDITKYRSPKHLFAGVWMCDLKYLTTVKANNFSRIINIKTTVDIGGKTTEKNYGFRSILC